MVRVGVIGAGRWGKNHVRVYSELDCDLIGIADTDSQKKELASQYSIQFATDYKHLLPLVDAVSIVVPTDLHFKVIKDCLLAGKHVLIEKPFTLKSEEAKELVSIAREKKLVLLVGYLFRFNAAVQTLKKEIKNIGDVQYITARYIHSSKPPRKDCGVIINFGVHLLDILVFILEERPTTIYCKKMNYLSKEREDCAFIILDYGTFIANLEVSWFHPLKKRDIWIIGSKHKVYADLFEQTITKYPIEISHEEVVSGKEMNLEIHKNEPLREELEYFCNSVENSDLPGDFLKAGTADEVFITKICEKCLESAETGKEIRIH